MSILTHFQAILEWHKAQKSPVASHLRPPLKPEKLQKLAKELPFTLPAEVKALYGLHDGLKDNTPLFHSFTFLPLSEAIAEYELACEMAEERVADPEDKGVYWKHTWFPLFGFQGDYYLIDCALGLASPVYARTGSEAAVIWYDHLERMLLTLRTCFEQGAYFYDDDEILTEDFDKANAIREQLNTQAARLEIESREPVRQELDEQPDGTRRLTSWFDDESHYIEQFYGPDQRKTGQAEYYQGELMRRDTYVYPSRDEVEITSENLMGMVMTTKTFGRINAEGQVEPLRIQTFMQDQLVYDQDLTRSEEDIEADFEEDWTEDDEAS